MDVSAATDTVIEHDVNPDVVPVNDDVNLSATSTTVLTHFASVPFGGADASNYMPSRDWGRGHVRRPRKRRVL